MIDVVYEKCNMQIAELFSGMVPAKDIYQSAIKLWSVGQKYANISSQKAAKLIFAIYLKVRENEELANQGSSLDPVDFIENLGNWNNRLDNLFIELASVWTRQELCRAKEFLKNESSPEAPFLTRSDDLISSIICILSTEPEL